MAGSWIAGGWRAPPWTPSSSRGRSSRGRGASWPAGATRPRWGAGAPGWGGTAAGCGARPAGGGWGSPPGAARVGRALGRLGREVAAEYPESLMVELAGGEADKVDGPVVTAAAQQGDMMAGRVMAEVGRRLGQGIAGLVNILDPDVVVVGGGVIDA